MKPQYKLLSIRYIKNARKSYIYYGGIITRGSSYYRGFGLVNKMPFEFMFTDSKIISGPKISSKLLIEEYKNHHLRKLVSNNNKV